MAAKKLRYFAGGEWKASKAAKWMDCFDPSTGAVIAQAPQCTVAEVEEAVGAAVAAYPAWADCPATSPLHPERLLRTGVRLSDARRDGGDQRRCFFGDLHTMGTDAVRFFTELKDVTAHWFSAEEARGGKVLNSWDGMISMPDQK